MTVSVVIPTYHRPHDLSMCLDSLAKQSMPPLEVTVVDNGLETASEAETRRLEKDFADIGISLCYVRNQRNSLTAARNLGSRLSHGDVVLFLDDDVILESDYIREIVRVYETHPTALGVQGYAPANENRSLVHLSTRSLLRLFFWYHLERDRCRLLPSLNGTYPLTLNKVISCQWLTGFNHSYRRHLLEEFRYDELLIRYSDGEDLDLSYRVLNRHPGSLFITPFAKLIHKRSEDGRAPERERVYMQEVYNLYLFFKLFEGNLGNRLIYVWSRLGWLSITLLRAAVKRKPGFFIEVLDILGAYVMCLRHLREIQRGDLHFFNNEFPFAHRCTR